ncbi:MAG: PEP-CTERM sorting domain-containing protein [Verrucomicrobiota bacterium]
MKKTLMAALAFAAAAWNGNAQLVGSFEDINYWVGEGPNRAAMVIQWNDGINPGALAWGYRWSGNATGLDMINAIAGNTTITDSFNDPLGSLTGADSRLAVGVVRYSFGDTIYSIVYSGSNPARTRADWKSGYWEYLIFGGNFEYTNWGDTEPSLYNTPGSPLYSNVNWFSSPIGMGDRELVDGSWDALSFAPGGEGRNVLQPVAVPEPAALGLTGLIGLLLIHARRRIFAR